MNSAERSERAQRANDGGRKPSAASGFGQGPEVELDHVRVGQQIAAGSRIGVAALVEHVAAVHDLETASGVLLDHQDRHTRGIDRAALDEHLVLQHRRELDAIIHARAGAFPLAQMAAVDRNILRLGLYESLYRNDTVPVRVAINEAIELAKEFGSESTPRFVNGVLGRQLDPSSDSPDSRSRTGDKR